MSKRLVLSDSNDDVDNLNTKKRFTIPKSNDNEDKDPCYDVEEFDKTRRMLRLCGYDETKATEIMIGIYNCPKLTDIAVSHTPSQAINVTVRSQSTAERTVSFDEDASPVPALSAAASAAYSAAIAAATEESSEDNNYYSLPALIVGGECSGDCAENNGETYGENKLFQE